MRPALACRVRPVPACLTRPRPRLDRHYRRTGASSTEATLKAMARKGEITQSDLKVKWPHLMWRSRPKRCRASIIMQ